ncbi:uncharacterized protein LOC135817897 [Sycon ciliatum]|uniref:uncharacterized protein LOC135817897 n=1 Tax=Sycon ciliatum TaxID=27933 RepID=UPI0031F624A9
MTSMTSSSSTVSSMEMADVGGHWTAVPLNSVTSANMTQLAVQFDPRLRLYFFVCSLVSLCCALAVVIIYCCKPQWRRHPDELLLNRTIMDGVMMACHIISYALGITPSSDVHPDADNHSCEWISLVYQFAVSASTAWYFIISLDLLLIIRNPFRPYTWYRHIYYPLVYLICAALAVALMLTKSYGLTALDFCWISMGHHDDGFTKQTYVYPVVLYFGWSAFLSLLSVGIVMYVAITLRRALASSSGIRRRLLTQLFVYVVMLSVEWSLRIVFWVLQNTYVRDHYHDNVVIHHLGLPFALVEGSRGIVDFVAWLSNSRRYRKLARCLCCCCVGRCASSREMTIQTEQSPLMDQTFSYATVHDLAKHEPSSATGAADSASNKEMRISSVLRHDLICCIAWGIVDMAPIDWHRQRQASSARTISFHHQSGDQQLPVTRKRLTCPMALKHLEVDFVDYAPAMFTELRSMSGIAPIEYAESFKKKTNNHGTVMDEVSSTGSSGSFFYFTGDKRYLVKTLQRSELHVLLDILPRYHRHMDRYRQSFLPHFFGLHETRLSPEQTPVPIVVMSNICHTPPGIPIHEKYDLKGSWVNRSSRKSDSKSKSKKDAEHFSAESVPTWKDCDLQGKRFHVGPERRRLILEQLYNDTQFLEQFGLMDYSLLVAVHHLTRPPGVVQQEVERQQRRQQRLRTNSTVAMPELPVDKSVRMHGARAGTTPTSLDRISLDPSAMLASYERSSTTQVHGSSYQSSPTLPRSNGKDRLLPTTIGESSACYKPEKIFYESGERSDMESTPAPVPLHRSFAGGLLTEPVEHVDSSNSYGHNDQLAAAATVPERQQSICYIGLIDIFQKYTLNKRAERFYKVHVRRKDPAGVSVMPVEPYAKRFMEKMEAIFV